MIWNLKSLFDHSASVSAEINGKWVPLRPISGTAISRVRAAWFVLTGKADAFTWPEGQ